MATVESIIPGLLMARLAELVLSPPLPVAWPDVPFTPPAGSYIEATFMPNTNVNLFVGNDATTQHQGILQVTVVSKAGGGIVAPMEIAGQVVAHFAKGIRVSGQGVTVRVSAKPSVARPLQDADRIRVPVTILYDCFAR
ncbi:DUF4128 domain-containing protein [Pseudaminobacter salicylatoxidans]|uniref:DUF4128 domain-containing protein n=1 Tax=Pseudaminobacter salicylatoxidans TaxID=93369 RepID=UPI0002DB310A|nr:DUF4128 domain-containing protein [Pseudaminobacter salicylatoxidans]